MDKQKIDFKIIGRSGHLDKEGHEVESKNQEITLS